MKRFVNGDETELDPAGAEVIQMADRLMVRTPDGAFSAVAIRQADGILISYRGRQYHVQERQSAARVGSQQHSGELRAPMPGQIVDVRNSVGDAVKKGDTILVLEAMKTQQPFLSPFDGKVIAISVEKGDQVADGTVLAVIQAMDEIHG